VALRPVYSVQIFCDQVQGGGNLITCPTGARLVVRCIDAFNLDDVAGNEILFYNPAHLTWIRFRTTGIAQAADLHWEGRQVINPGETIFIQALSGTWSVWISGYELAVP
jgi:hypothetical protein